MSNNEINNIISYYTTSGDNLVTALYLTANWVPMKGEGFGYSGFGLYEFGG